MAVANIGISNLEKLGLGKIGELRKLKLTTKNKVRAILRCDLNDSLKVINKLRRENPARELVKIENALRQYAPANNNIVPNIFPNLPQTTDDFYRLESLDLVKKVAVIEIIVAENLIPLSKFFQQMGAVDRAIIAGQFTLASQEIGHLTRQFGFSHSILRKSAVILTSANDSPIPEVENLLELAGLERKNLVVSSLINCFKTEQDFFSLKKSIMSLRRRGNSNKYTRDICRIPFQPIARDSVDLTELLQSARQSSLIDAVLPYLKPTSALVDLFDKIDADVVTMDEICSQYLDADDGEFNFYKQSSAWLENRDIVRYRLLLDNFYDSPESDYLKVTPELISQISPWVKDVGLNNLATAAQITEHPFENLRRLERNGSMTRSAIFNFKMHISEGYEPVEEKPLFVLMDVTRDLAKTSNAIYLGNMARLAASKRTKLILYFLIARKSKNELDNHTLRRILQGVVINEFAGHLVPFFDHLAMQSKAVAVFAYEVCTEDFIAKLFNIIHSTSEITETRASLHKWMGHFSGEKSFFDRARTLLIDHQLNKIRDEIDDNRIYVDAARFSEWINDEVMRDLSSILMSIELKSALLEDDPDPQLVKLVELCYTTFCANNIFGIASYLGRRIRHGTFKGHLYSSVISIERTPKYRELLADLSVAPRWEKWKAGYQEKINQIIRDRLHIESTGKRDGLLKPSQITAGKTEILAACARLLARDYFELKNSYGSIPIIIDFCWRLAESDLKGINTFLKNQKSVLIDRELLLEMRSAATWGKGEIANDFYRELIRTIDEKLMSMYNWFKRPLNVSPKASLSLLYKAVVAEVQETFPDFSTDTEYEEERDIDLIGGAYHVIYDSLYVIVYNAAKHGRFGDGINRYFSLQDGMNIKKTLTLEIASTIRDTDDEKYVNGRLEVHPDDDMTDAQVSEDRSGIRKLHHLAQCTPGFSISQLTCRDRKVIITLKYTLEH
jgi:hypothetical protein